MTARNTHFGTAWRTPRLSWQLALVLPFLAAPIYGQSLGDVARQERARKQAEAQESTHVYDNDDLTRDQILLPADRDRVAAPAQAAQPAQAVAPPPAAPTAPTAAPAPTVAENKIDSSVDPNADPNTMPLGDIARHYRALKAARQQQQQSQSAANQFAPAPVAPSLASPTPSQSPARPEAPSRPAAPAVPSAPNEADVYLDPSVDPNTLPLGDIARHYRALKAAGQQQTAQSAGAQPPPPSPAPSDADLYLDPNVDPNTLPLGDIARHYRALKAAQQRADAQSAETISLPSAPPLADPTFTEPPARPVKPASPLPMPATQISPAQPIHRAIRSAGRDEENIAGTFRLRVRSGDTLWSLARKYLGRGKDWLALATRNPQVGDPRHLQVGTLLRLPDDARVRDSGAAERVRVEHGQSLWKLSQFHFGSGGDWTCVAQANPDLHDANLIFPGQMITIPATCAAGDQPHARRPSISADSLAGANPPEMQQPR